MIKCENGLNFYIKKNTPVGEGCRGVITFPEDYVVLDLETTGLRPKDDRIIEFAAVKVEKGKVTDTFQSLCDPGMYIPLQIQEITGITNEMVRNAPNPLSVLPQFLEFVGEGYIVGHNVPFDIRFIRASADFFCNDFIDTLAIFRKLHPELSHHKLSCMVDFYGKTNTSAHRALSDCFATQECFEAMRIEAQRIFGSTDEFLCSI